MGHAKTASKMSSDTRYEECKIQTYNDAGSGFSVFLWVVFSALQELLDVAGDIWKQHEPIHCPRVIGTVIYYTFVHRSVGVIFPIPKCIGNTCRGSVPPPRASFERGATLRWFVGVSRYRVQKDLTPRACRGGPRCCSVIVAADLWKDS